MIIVDPRAEDDHVIYTVRPYYGIGAYVYFCPGGRKQGMVTGIVLRETSLAYRVRWDEMASESEHFGFELTSMRPQS